MFPNQIMKNLFERIQSLEDEMLKLAEELEETRRASSNIIRLGVVEEAKAKAVKVKTGKNFANNIPFSFLLQVAFHITVAQVLESNAFC